MTAFFFHRFDVQGETTRRDLLLAYLATDDFNEADFRDKVNYHIERDLIPDEIAVVVRSTIADKIAHRFQHSKTLDALKGRIRDKACITLRPFGVNGKEIGAKVIHGTAVTLVSVESFIRRSITKLVRDHHGFVTAAGNYHFELPSQRHTERFIRISNILVDSAEISFIALGTLPFVDPNVGTIYIDTPALFPIVSAISDHLRAFSPDRAPVFAENFRSYAGYRDFSFETKPENMVLISASSSGRLGQAIMEAAQFEAKQIVHLLYSGTNDAEQRIVCNIRFEKRQNPTGFTTFPQDFKAGECPLCIGHSPVVQLVGDHFELPGPKPIPLVFGIGDVNPKFPALIKRVVGRGILRVGFGRANQADVARQFYVASDELLQCLVDSNRLSYVLNQAVPASLTTIVAANDRSRRLAELVQTHIVDLGGKSPPIVSADELESLSRNDSTKSVLITSTVIESGRSLQDISRDLRRPFPFAPQIYVVGLAKYLSDARLQRLKSNLVQTHGVIPHEFIPIEQIQLPSSSEANAWVAERRLLSDRRFFEGMPTEEEMDWKDRFATLNRQSEALVDNLFLSNFSATYIRLQSGFALWPDGLAEKGSQADVFFTIASVLQNLRAREEDEGAGRALRADLFQQTLIDPGNFGRFSDGIIQAAFLRAAQPNELNYSASPVESAAMARYARRIIESSALPRGEAATELLMAVATKRLRLQSKDYEHVLAPFDNLPRRVERMRSIASKFLQSDGLLRPD